LVAAAFVRVASVYSISENAIAQRPDAVRAALEAFALEGYRSRVLTASQVRTLLGFETRNELDGFLKAHDVWERAYSVEDLEKDIEGVEKTA
jgi:hypothetical protein